MKKWIAVLGSILLWGVGAVFAYASESETVGNLSWSIYWEGLLCTGVYSGETVSGVPNGYGEFTGNVIINNEETSEIIYQGNWEDGELSGEGHLQNTAKGRIYEGKFKENKLNGTIKEYNMSSGGVYSLKRYSLDIANGFSWTYNDAGDIVDYDCFFKGLSVKQICAEAKVFDYKELLYNTDDYLYQKMKLNCIVESVYQEGTDNFVKVKDDTGNYYILLYDSAYKSVATNYMPVLNEKDEITVYGYFIGKNTYTKEVTMYPSIDAVCAEWVDGENLDVQNLSYNYSDFLNYPYVYRGKTIEVEGILIGVVSSNDTWIRILIESDSDSSGGEKEIYACKIKNTDENISILPSTGEKISVKGKLALISKHLIEEKYIFYPLIEINKIVSK